MINHRFDGAKGYPGLDGTDGLKGQKGSPGITGPVGRKVIFEALFASNCKFPYALFKLFMWSYTHTF